MDGMLELPEKWIPCDYQLPRARIKHSSSDEPGWFPEFRDLQAARCKKPVFDVYCTTYCGACSCRAEEDEGSSLQ